MIFVATHQQRFCRDLLDQIARVSAVFDICPERYNRLDQRIKVWFWIVLSVVGGGIPLCQNSCRLQQLEF